jgi:hypothetical protein
VAAGVAFWFFGAGANWEQSRLPGPYDGPIRLLVLGDAQMFRDDGRPGWPTVAKNVLSGRVHRHVELTVESAGTAAEVNAYLSSITEPYPTLIVAAVGWEDAAPGPARSPESASGRIAKLAGQSIVDAEPGRFYLRVVAGEPTRASPVEFLEQLGAAKEAAAAIDVPLVFVQQAGRVDGSEGPAIAATAAARPGPWISLLPKLLRERDPAVWWQTADPIALTPQGHRRIGGIIGEGLEAHLR